LCPARIVLITLKIRRWANITIGIFFIEGMLEAKRMTNFVNQRLCPKRSKV